MITNEVIHIGSRNREQTTDYLISVLTMLQLARIIHVEIISGPQVSHIELLDIIKNSNEIMKLIRSINNHFVTVYVILRDD